MVDSEDRVVDRTGLIVSGPVRMGRIMSGKGPAALFCRVAVLGGSYFLAAELGARLSPPGHFAAFWPPSGLLLAVLLRSNPRSWPLLVLGVLPANLAFDLLHAHPIGVSLAYCAGNSLEAVVGAWLMRRFVGTTCSLGSLKEVLGLATLSALCSTTLSATIGAAATVQGHGALPYWSMWQVWWVADVVGVLLVAPVVLTWTEPGMAVPRRRRIVEWALFFSVLAIAMAALVAGTLAPSAVLLPIPFVVLPLLGWAAWRFGPRGVASAMLVLGLTSLWNYVHGRGFFAGSAVSGAHPVVALQAFLGVGAVTFLGLAASITERRRAADALHETETRFQTMADGAPIAIWMLDLEGRCEFVNKVWFETTGCSNDMALRPGWFSFLHPEDAEAVLRTYQAAIEARAPVRVEFRVRRRDGVYRWMLGCGTPRVDRSGTYIGYIGSDTDITDMKEGELARERALAEEARARARAERQAAELATLNQQLAEAREAAQQASRLKSEFLANVSHEIRTPMTSILGLVDLLTDPEGSAGDGRNLVERIRRNGQHLFQLINDILDLSKIEAGEVTIERIPCSLASLVEEVTSSLRDQAIAKGLTFEVEFGENISDRIHTDPTRFRQILLNLVANAVKFTEAGGVSLIVTMSGAGSARPVLCFEVRDTGIGIEPEAHARLFRPFVQVDASTSRRFGGTGLGLAIAKRLAGMLGGDIALESTPGGGSRFTLSVPVESRENAPLFGEAPGWESKEGHVRRTTDVALRLSGRVLLVEDTPDIVFIISLHLKRAGADVQVADNGLDACKRALEAAANGVPFDVILMDMQMPVLDGYRATALLREKGYTRPIVALTAHAMEGDREKCLRAGCNDFATKPIDAEGLIAIVARHMRTVGWVTGDVHDRAAARDPSGLARLTARFLANLPERAAVLEQTLDEGDLDSLARLAHQLKGTAAAYGFPDISDAAALLEQSARVRRAPGEVQRRFRRVADLCRHPSGRTIPGVGAGQWVEGA